MNHLDNVENRFLFRYEHYADKMLSVAYFYRLLKHLKVLTNKEAQDLFEIYDKQYNIGDYR